MSGLGQVWVTAAAALGGEAPLAQPAADHAERSYADPARGYHGTAHVLAVLRDIAVLAGSVLLTGDERACVDAAAVAHDVVYDGRPGEDERLSARWAHEALLAAGARSAAAARVRDLVLATAEHTAPPGDRAAQVLLDADLAILASAPGAYAAYVAAVRREYRHLDEGQWRTGRAAVLASLAERPALFQTPMALAMWEAPARANMLRELATLAGPGHGRVRK
jgi:predicted metal-dependent HD superfamily phosphohydrolase